MPAKFTGRHPSPPHAYVPVDPFKPSIAFSLNNILRPHDAQEAGRGRSSLHDPPRSDPPQQLMSEFPGYKQRRRKVPMASHREPRYDSVSTPPLRTTFLVERGENDSMSVVEPPHPPRQDLLQGLLRPQSTRPSNEHIPARPGQAIEGQEDRRPIKVFDESRAHADLPPPLLHTSRRSSKTSTDLQLGGESGERNETDTKKISDSGPSWLELFDHVDIGAEKRTQLAKEPISDIITYSRPRPIPPPLAISSDRRIKIPPRSALRGFPTEDPQTTIHETARPDRAHPSAGHRERESPYSPENPTLSTCRRCKILKFECQYPNGLKGKCERCAQGNHECVIYTEFPGGMIPKPLSSPWSSAEEENGISQAARAPARVTQETPATISLAHGREVPELTNEPRFHFESRRRTDSSGAVVNKLVSSTGSTSRRIYTGDLSASLPSSSLSGPREDSDVAEIFHEVGDARQEKKLVRACQRCKNLKVKCQYPIGYEGKCERCAKGNHECIMPGRSTKKPSQLSSPPWISAEEEKGVSRLAIASSYIDEETPVIVAPTHGKEVSSKESKFPPKAETQAESSGAVLNERTFLTESPLSPIQPVKVSDVPDISLLFGPREESNDADSFYEVDNARRREVSPQAGPRDRTHIKQQAMHAWRSFGRGRLGLSMGQPSTGKATWSSPPSPRSGDHRSPVVSSPISLAPSGSDYVPIAPPTPRMQVPPRARVEVSAEATFPQSDSLFKSDSLIEEAPKVGPSTRAYILAFIFDTLPRQIYLHMLLRLPSLYFSRVTRIFEEAEMSMPMIKQGILEAARAKQELGYDPIIRNVKNSMSRVHLPMEYWEPQLENPAYANLQTSWQGFVDALQKEWKTLNIISVLLLTAILTILQIPSAAADPLTRYSAILSMICALMSLLYGCIYIIRFGTMRKTYKGAEWAEEAQRSRTGILWNVWVLLAMPATWLAWSMIMYIVTIMSFVWRTTPFSQPNSIDESSAQIFVPRIIISLVVALGFVYSVLIAATLRRYGEMMDRAWQTRIWGWMRDADTREDKAETLDEKSIDRLPIRQVIDPFPPMHGYEQSSIIKDLLDHGSGKQERPREFKPRKSELMASSVNVAGPRPMSALIAFPGHLPSFPPFPPGTPPEGTARNLLEYSTTTTDIPEVDHINHKVGAKDLKIGTGQSYHLQTSSNLPERPHSVPSGSDSVDHANYKLETMNPNMCFNPQTWVRLFGLSQAAESAASDVIQEMLSLANISKEEWGDFEKQTLRNMETLRSPDNSSKADFLSLASSLDEFNYKIQSQNFAGKVFLCREFTGYETSYAVYCTELRRETSRGVSADDVARDPWEPGPKRIPQGLRRLDLLMIDSPQGAESPVSVVSWGLQAGAWHKIL